MMTESLQTRVLGFVLAVLLAAPVGLFAADTPTSQPAQSATITEQTVKLSDEALTKGLAYIRAAQKDDGSWVADWGPAVTAMVVKALVQSGEKPDSPVITKAVKFILASQKTEGPSKGAFVDKRLGTYNTAIVLSTLAPLNAKMPGKPYDAAIKAALDYLQKGQFDESEDIKKDNGMYGGWGYDAATAAPAGATPSPTPGGRPAMPGRPDLSNTAMVADALGALKDAGYLKADDPMFAKVQQFVTACQNRSESNKTNWGKYKVGDDGSFIYVPASSADPTKSNAAGKAEEKRPDGSVGLRGYGSMSYAGFKSFLYSGLSTDDPRVAAAFKWLSQNFTVAENPGMPEGKGNSGLYYYYHLMARGLRSAGAGANVLTDRAGVKHHWRDELIAKLAELQDKDGSWVNKADNWEEGNPVLVTTYCVLAIQEARANTVVKK